MSFKYYAGIGSRATPDHVLDLMTLIAERLQECGYTLRSGGAKGADQAFSKGVYIKCQEVYRPRPDDQPINPYEEVVASKHHPNWLACTPYVKALHRRNVQIILGKDLEQPADFVVCWTPNGKDVGGTGLAIRVAKTFEIPVHNLYNPKLCMRFIRWLENPSTP